MALDKAGGGNILFTPSENSAINTELLMMLRRILKSDLFSAARNFQAHCELLQGVMIMLLL